MKRALPAIALIIGLGLAGCSGGGSAPADSGDGAQAEKTEAAAPAAVQLDKAALTTIVESTKVGDASFTAIDLGADDSGTSAMSTAAKTLESAEFTPSECKDISIAALNSAAASNGTTVAGMSSDNTLAVGLSSFADASGAETQFKSAGLAADKCKSVTMKVQGMEMTLGYELFDATVAGADDSVGVSTTMAMGGTAAFTTTAVTSRVGNTVVNLTNMKADADQGELTDGAAAFVDAVKTAK